MLCGATARARGQCVGDCVSGAGGERYHPPHFSQACRPLGAGHADPVEAPTLPLTNLQLVSELPKTRHRE